MMTLCCEASLFKMVKHWDSFVSHCKHVYGHYGLYVVLLQSPIDGPGFADVLDI
jgi:hypothetical protein